jgi:signal transduction histidine kinase
MPAHGDLILKTANVTDKDMMGKVYDPKPGNYVLLTMTDTGGGMDKETQERIFEPFFTTKEMGSSKGTGLGLASVYGIIKGHGGYIDVDSELGRGTTFTVYLPATEKKVEETVQPVEEIVKRTSTILLVDDEEKVL